jgi:hypothetical protein
MADIDKFLEELPEDERDQWRRVPQIPNVRTDKLSATFLDGQRKQRDDWKRYREAQDIKIASTKVTDRQEKSRMLRAAKELNKVNK